MINTKLHAALVTLEKSEWSSFRKFLLMESSHESEIFRLFTFLHSQKNKLEKLKETDEVKTKYFPNYSSKQFLNLISKLYNLFEEWLTYYQLRQQNYDGQLLLLKALNNRGLYKHANQIAKNLELRIKHDPTINNEQNNALAQLSHHQYYSDNPIKYQQGPDILQNLVNTFLLQFKEQGILYITELYNWGDVQNHDFSASIQQFMTIIENIDDSYISKITHELIALVGQDHLPSLYLLKKHLDKGQFTEGSQLQTLIFLYVLTSALRLWRKGLFQNAELLTEIYDYGFNSGVLLKKGKIPQTRFHNIISTIGALRSKKWAYQFINKWSPDVNSTYITSTLNLGKAQICFIHHDYEEIIKLTRNLEFDDLEIKMRSLGLELISLYVERDNYRDLLNNTLHNFKRTLKRNKSKITHNFYQGNLNLIDVIQKMIKKEFKTVDIDLNAYDNLIYRKWLSESINKI